MSHQENAVDQDHIELEMLRVFYQAWVHLHSLPRSSNTEFQLTEAAKSLVEAGHTVAEFRKSRKE